MTCTFGTLTRALERGGGGGTAAGSLPPLPSLALLPNSLEPLSARQNAGRLGEREHTNYENSVFAKSWQKVMSFNLELGKLGGLHPLCVRFPISFFLHFFRGGTLCAYSSCDSSIDSYRFIHRQHRTCLSLAEGKQAVQRGFRNYQIYFTQPYSLSLSLSPCSPSLFPSLSSSYSNVAKNQTCRVM